jgi:hypothetical protein
MPPICTAGVCAYIKSSPNALLGCERLAIHWNLPPWQRDCSILVQCAVSLRVNLFINPNILHEQWRTEGGGAGVYGPPLADGMLFLTA